MKALITGANKGIGFAIAQNLGKRGYEILLGARQESLGQEAVQKLQADGISASFVKVDLNDLEGLESLSDLSDVDILVNNAGIAGNIATEKSKLDMNKSAFDYTTTDLQETLNTNFLGTHAVITNLLPALSENAKILNVTVPVSQKYWMPLAYVTSKAAQNAMTFAFGHQFEKDKSKRQIFGVMPGAIATDLNGAKAGEGGMVRTPYEAAENITSFLFDGKNHNAELINFDGTIIDNYEPGLMGKNLKDIARNGLKRKFGKN
ncbi:SDR family NAD(P)-dependent oxidoreductase [Lactococcus protaetiae]|uniref:SDR family NAD(P)-dependent oxidoreductase n=1 Tax=Lactococcus protaetiae TaxID=2592653 RepID=A0A514Z707_9LACT|nr:SDR family NAD(P)-dependent oxidoreductase [Lactococcus protaetiae]QDK70389.1 SDR family NAD(P)-dependent oxidoreductase [Lactococcus protaetiae]